MTSKDDEPGQSPRRLYRWTCPYCEQSGLQMTTPSGGEDAVLDTVRTHVRFAGDDAHGPKGSVPEDLPEDVDGCIVVESDL